MICCKKYCQPTSDVQMQMVSYSALFCYETMVYLKKYDPSICVEHKGG